MKDLEKILSKFQSVLKIIFDTNVVIGGSAALKLHGLEIGREISDVDIIIYNPTPSQKLFLKLVGQKNSSSLDSYEKRVYKFTRTFLKKYSIDVIISYEEFPENLLSCEILSHTVKIQSVENIVKAKASYVSKVDGRGSLLHISKKDATDMINLKNLNFNL